MPPNNVALLKRFLEFVPIEHFAEHYAADVTGDSFFGFPLGPILEAEDALRNSDKPSIGYFSMEYGLSSNTYNAMKSSRAADPANLSTDHHVFSNIRSIDYYVELEADHLLDLPIYSGGLGVLAGDTLKSAADREVSLAAVGILWNKGYFKQNFWFKEGQIPEETSWRPRAYPGLVPIDFKIEIPLKHETVHLKLWKYFVFSHDKKRVVPLVLLDSNVEENSPHARTVTSQLYKSDNAEWKILQRAILGLGGMKAFDALGYRIHRYHLNEGHAALAFTQKALGLGDKEIEALKNKFAYTCHTPVAAGHDRFPRKTLQDVLPDEEVTSLKKFGSDSLIPDAINLTRHAMNASRFVNAVAKKHHEVMRLQFPEYASRIDYVTNGVHTHTWVSEPVAALLDEFDKKIGGWRRDPMLLKNVLSLKDDKNFRQKLWDAHVKNKENLTAYFARWRFEPHVFTIAWARRIAAYKRPSLILQDAARLLDIAGRIGPIQILLAGKAHPKDDLGFTYVNEMLAAIDSLAPRREQIRVLMLENYDTYFGRLLTSGVDVWLNNPLPPFEASGTSGMKAILNGVLQLSTLDGWMVEAADKNAGWIFGYEHHGKEIGDEKNLRLKEDSKILYDRLEEVMRLYYQASGANRAANLDSDWITKMVHAVAAAGHFSTHRMVSEYERKIWSV